MACEKSYEFREGRTKTYRDIKGRTERVKMFVTTGATEKAN